MNSEALLMLARGPLFDAALMVFIAGMLLRLAEVLALGRKGDLAEARGSGFWGGVRTVLMRNIPRTGFFRAAPLRTINGYILHVGLFIVIFLFVPHIAIIENVTGLGWPGLPSGVVDAVAAVTILSLVVALVFRLNHPVLRFLSTFSDYLVWLVTFLPVLTGYLAFNHLLLSYTSMLTLHILSIEVFMVIAPFTSLTHMFGFLSSRWYQGSAAGHRGVAS